MVCNVISLLWKPFCVGLGGCLLFIYLLTTYVCMFSPAVVSPALTEQVTSYKFQ